MNRIPATLLVAFASVAPLAGAQETTPMTLQSPPPEAPRSPGKAPDLTLSEAMRPGGLVRVQSGAPRVRLKGKIKALDDDRLVIVDRKGTETSIPWSSVQRLEVSVGVRHTYGAAAAVGAFAGALAGAVMPDDDPCFAPGCPDEAMFSRSNAVLAGGAIGALLGLCAEAISKPTVPKWAPVPLPYAPASVPAIGFRIVPRRDGVVAGLRWTF